MVQGPSATADTDFAAVARSVGIPSRRVEDEGALQDGLDEAFGRSGPYLIDANVDPSGYGGVLAAIRGRAK